MMKCLRITTPCSSPPDRRRRVESEQPPAPPRNAPEIPCPSNPCGNPPRREIPPAGRRNRGCSLRVWYETVGRIRSRGATVTSINRNTRILPLAQSGTKRTPFSSSSFLRISFIPHPSRGPAPRASPAGTAPLFLLGKTRLTATSRFQRIRCLPQSQNFMVSAHRYVRILFPHGRIKQAPEHIPLHHVVRVHKTDILSRSRFHAAVPRRGKHRCFSGQSPGRGRPCPAIGAISPPYGRRVTVIDANHFDIFHALTGQAFPYVLGRNKRQHSNREQ